MKKRRTLVIGLLLIAALALGIAYAATDGVLTVNGKVQTVKQPFNLQISGVEQDESHNVVAGNAPAVTCSDSFPAKSVTLNVSGMASEGDYVIAKLTIDNKNDCTMYLTSTTVTYGVDNAATSDNIDVSMEGWTGPIEIAADDEVDVLVKISMKKSCTDETYQELFTLRILGSPTAPTP